MAKKKTPFDDIVAQVERDYCPRPKGNHQHANGEPWKWDIELFIHLVEIASNWDELAVVDRNVGAAKLHALQCSRPPLGMSGEAWEHSVYHDVEVLSRFTDNRRRELADAAEEKARARANDLEDEIAAADARVFEELQQAYRTVYHAVEARAELMEAYNVVDKAHRFATGQPGHSVTPKVTLPWGTPIGGNAAANTGNVARAVFTEFVRRFTPIAEPDKPTTAEDVKREKQSRRYREPTT